MFHTFYSRIQQVCNLLGMIAVTAIFVALFMVMALLA